MSVRIGSARNNELGGISGGKPGDQLQTAVPDYHGECSIEDWYLHSKGWVVCRSKSESAREKIAQDMEYICDNPHIGYDQPRDQTLYKAAKPFGFNASLVTTDCDTDCARAVRVCVLYAGIDVRDFYTATEVYALAETGEFDILYDDKYCCSSDYLLRGDILVTRTQGHTAVVLDDGAFAHTTPSYTTTGNVWQRTGPGVEYPTIQVVPKNSVFNVLTTTEDSDGNPWAQGEYKGIYGYCSMKYLTPAAELPKFVTKGNVYLRKGAGILSGKVCVIPKGLPITATGQTKNVLGTTWREVYYNGKTGWVSGKYLA